MIKKIIIVCASLLLLALVIISVTIFFIEYRDNETPNVSVANTSKIPESDRQFLIKRGLTDPVNEIAKDLMSHPELIPCEGILGGTHDFYMAKIAILGRDRVRAVFGDGHNDGVIELSYKVSKGHISWEVIKSNCFDIEI